MDKKKLNIRYGFSYGVEYKWEYVNKVLEGEGFEKEEIDRVEESSGQMFDYEKEGKILIWRKNEVNSLWRCNYRMINGG